jgi:hypothetical protein
MQKRNNTPHPILPKSLSQFSLLDIDPLETARQLSLLEMKTYLHIEPIELLTRTFPKRYLQSFAKNIKKMVLMSSKITEWVICTILQSIDLKRRALTLQYFIRVAEVSCILM